MMKELDRFFESKIEIPLIRHGKKQRIETLIKEETLLLAKYLRCERDKWNPRIPYARVREPLKRELIERAKL